MFHTVDENVRQTGVGSLLLLGGEGHGLYLPETDQGRISLPWMEDNGEKDLTLVVCSTDAEKADL